MSLAELFLAAMLATNQCILKAKFRKLYKN